MEQRQIEQVRLAVAGDADAFGQLLDELERPLMAIAFAILRCPQKAADVVQEAALRAWMRRRQLSDPTRFDAWLASIVRLTAIDQHRSNQLRHATQITEEHHSGRDADAPDQLMETERNRQIEIALDQLDEVSRQAVVLRYFDGRSSRDIATLLDLTPQAIDMRLSRARKQLRTLLAPIEQTDASSDRATTACRHPDPMKLTQSTSSDLI